MNLSPASRGGRDVHRRILGPLLKRLRDLPSQQKLTLMMMLSAALSLGIAAASLLLYASYQAGDGTRRELESIMALGARDLAAAVVAGDARAATQLLEPLRARPAVESACVYRHDDARQPRFLAGYARGGPVSCPPVNGQPGEVSVPGGTARVAPLLAGEKRVGVLRVVSSHGLQMRELRLQAGLLGGVLLLSLVAVLPLAWAIQGFFSGPLLDLAWVARRIARTRNYSLRAPQAARDEVGKLASDFNLMVEEIERRDREVRGRAARLAAIVDGVVDGVVVMDGAGRIESLNLAAQKMFAGGREQGVGGRFAEHIAPPYDQEFHRRFQHEFEGFTTSGGDERSTRAWQAIGLDGAGRAFPLELSLTRWIDREGLHVCALVRDLTEHNRIEQMRLEKEAALSVAAAKSHFLATMSHEIRTPLNGVLGMAELLRGSVLDPAQRDQVETILGAGHHLLAVINDVLDFSRLESGRVEVESRPTEVLALVESVLSLAVPMRGEKDLRVISQIEADVPAWVLGDAGRIRQILVNYLSNAVKFTEHGEVRLTVRRATAGSRMALHFAVSDTGIGIPGDCIGRLFESFTQADKSTTRRFGGSGLGLAICRKLAECMDGRVWAESEEGRGSTFHCLIPLQACEAPAVVVERRSGPRPAGGGPSADLAQRFPLCILVAEDNPVNIKFITLLLRRMGYAPDVALDGRKALAALKEQPYDLILMDVQMPEMDGLQAAREIQRLWPEHERPRIVALTAGVLDEQRRECEMAGMDRILAKPLVASDLIEVLRECPRRSVAGGGTPAACSA